MKFLLAAFFFTASFFVSFSQVQPKLVRAKIVRFADSPESCAIGRLFVDGKFVCYTLERPWLWNQSNVSCIPTGVYWGDLKFENENGWKIRIDNVKGRYGILMHVGNWEINTQGCILLGMNYERNLNNPQGYICQLSESQKAIEKFKEAIYGSKLYFSPTKEIRQEFILTVETEKYAKFMESITGKPKNEKPEDKPVNKESSILGSLLMLIDISGSMQGEKIESAKKAAIQGIKTSLTNKTEIAILAFSESCENPIKAQTGFSTDEKQLVAFIDSLSANGGTLLSEAMKAANKFMARNKHKSSQNHMIFLLADGDDQCGNLSQILTMLKSNGILFRHETIGLGIDPYSAAAYQFKQLPQQSGGRYYYAQQHSQLASIFQDAIATMKMIELIGKFKLK